MKSNQTIEASYQTFQSKQIRSNGANKIGSAARAKEKLSEFQGLMVSMMLSSMRATIPKNDLVNGGQGEEIFQQMLDSEYSKKGGSADMLHLNKNLRQSFHLPLSETFSWSQLENVNEKELTRINHEISLFDPRSSANTSKGEPTASKATKQLDHFVKNKDLLKFLPKEKLDTLDKSFVKSWKNKRDNYLDEKGLSASYGPKLWQMNKELIEKIYPAIKVKNNVGLYKQVSKAYGTSAELN